MANLDNEQRSGTSKKKQQQQNADDDDTDSMAGLVKNIHSSFSSFLGQSDEPQEEQARSNGLSESEGMSGMELFESFRGSIMEAVGGDEDDSQKATKNNEDDETDDDSFFEQKKKPSSSKPRSSHTLRQDIAKGVRKQDGDDHSESTDIDGNPEAAEAGGSAVDRMLQSYVRNGEITAQTADAIKQKLTREGRLEGMTTNDIMSEIRKIRSQERAHEAPTLFSQGDASGMGKKKDSALQNWLKRKTATMEGNEAQDELNNFSDDSSESSEEEDDHIRRRASQREQPIGAGGLTAAGQAKLEERLSQLGSFYDTQRNTKVEQEVPDDFQILGKLTEKGRELIGPGMVTNLARKYDVDERDVHMVVNMMSVMSIDGETIDSTLLPLLIARLASSSQRITMVIPSPNMLPTDPRLPVEPVVAVVATAIKRFRDVDAGAGSHERSDREARERSQLINLMRNDRYFGLISTAHSQLNRMQDVFFELSEGHRLSVLLLPRVLRRLGCGHPSTNESDAVFNYLATLLEVDTSDVQAAAHGMVEGSLSYEEFLGLIGVLMDMDDASSDGITEEEMESSFRHALGKAITVEESDISTTEKKGSRQVRVSDKEIQRRMVSHRKKQVDAHLKELMELAESELSDVKHSFTPVAFLFLYDLFNRFSEAVIIRRRENRVLKDSFAPMLRLLGMDTNQQQFRDLRLQYGDVSLNVHWRDFIALLRDVRLTLFPLASHKRLEKLAYMAAIYDLPDYEPVAKFSISTLSRIEKCFEVYDYYENEVVDSHSMRCMFARLGIRWTQEQFQYISRCTLGVTTMVHVGDWKSYDISECLSMLTSSAHATAQGNPRQERDAPKPNQAANHHEKLLFSKFDTIWSLPEFQIRNLQRAFLSQCSRLANIEVDAIVGEEHKLLALEVVGINLARLEAAGVLKDHRWKTTVMTYDEFLGIVHQMMALYGGQTTIDQRFRDPLSTIPDVLLNRAREEFRQMSPSQESDKIESSQAAVVLQTLGYSFEELSVEQYCKKVGILPQFRAGWIGWPSFLKLVAAIEFKESGLEDEEISRRKNFQTSSVTLHGATDKVDYSDIGKLRQELGAFVENAYEFDRYMNRLNRVYKTLQTDSSKAPPVRPPEPEDEPVSKKQLKKNFRATSFALRRNSFKFSPSSAEGASRSRNRSRSNYLSMDDDDIDFGGEDDDDATLDSAASPSTKGRFRGMFKGLARSRNKSNKKGKKGHKDEGNALERGLSSRSFSFSSERSASVASTEDSFNRH